MRVPPLLLCALLCATGCVAVSPLERGKLASPCMELALGDTAMTAEYRAKVLESLTAGGLPGTAPGGGCGCTQ